MKLPVILDIGHSIDDFFALALAACSPEIELAGVTTAQDHARSRARVARMLLDAYGRRDVPVAAGDGAGFEEPFYAQYLLDSARPALRSGTAIERGACGGFEGAVEFLSRALKERDGVVLACAGPLTNIAALLDRDPVAARRIKDVYFMGGWLSQALPEHNVRLDPESVASVLAHDVPLTALGYEVTRGYRLLRPHHERLVSSLAPGAQALRHLYEAWREAKQSSAPGLLDPMLIAVLCGLVPARTEEARVRVLTSGPGRGTMFRDEEGGRTIRIVTWVDASRFMDEVVSRIAPYEHKLPAEENPASWNVHVRAAYDLNHYPGWTMAVSPTRSHALALVQCGGATAVVDGRSFELTEGAALYAAPGSEVLMKSPGGMKAFWIYFDVTVQGNDQRDAPLGRLPWPNHFERRARSEAWCAMAKRVESYWLHPWPEAALLCKAAFMELVADMCTQAHEQELQAADASREVALHAKRWIESHVADPITLEDIANAVSVSKYHLLRLFRQAFGVTPLRYQRRLRMLHARQLLNLRHLSVQEIAKRVGYESTSAFARAYKQEFGAAPSSTAWRG